VCQEINKASQKIKVTRDKRKFRKIYTILEGFDDTIDLKALAKELKNKLACGGTAKDNHIELQGDHLERVKKILLGMNYTEDQLDIMSR
jgi:translation initiation factor 1